MPHYADIGRVPQFHPKTVDGQVVNKIRPDRDTTSQRQTPHVPELEAERAKAVVPLQGVEDPGLDFKWLGTALTRYNSLYNFAPLRNSQPEVLAQRTALDHALEHARTTLAQAKEAIDSAAFELHNAALEESHRLPVLNRNPQWYEQGDLLDMCEDDLDRALEAHPPTDASHYSLYVRRCITARIDRYAQDGIPLRNAAQYLDRGDSDYGYWKIPPDPKFASKVLRLVFALLSVEGGAVTAFHGLVWAKANILRLDWYLPTTLHEIERLGNGIDDVIKHLLGRETDHIPLARLGIPDLNFISAQSPRYYNVAQARRMAYATWKTQACNDQDPNCFQDITDERGESVGPCWHMHNEHLTAMLNKHAYEEIEDCVWVATQHALPPELTEMVFEYALANEEVPADVKIFDEVTGVAKDEYRWWCHYINN